MLIVSQCAAAQRKDTDIGLRLVEARDQRRAPLRGSWEPRHVHDVSMLH